MSQQIDRLNRIINNISAISTMVERNASYPYTFHNDMKVLISRIIRHVEMSEQHKAKFIALNHQFQDHCDRWSNTIPMMEDDSNDSAITERIREIQIDVEWFSEHVMDRFLMPVSNLVAFANAKSFVF